MLQRLSTFILFLMERYEITVEILVFSLFYAIIKLLLDYSRLKRFAAVVPQKRQHCGLYRLPPRLAKTGQFAHLSFRMVVLQGASRFMSAIFSSICKPRLPRGTTQKGRQNAGARVVQPGRRQRRRSAVIGCSCVYDKLVFFRPLPEHNPLQPILEIKRPFLYDKDR